jgi:peptide/nickel transport system substrate-binding protein
MRQLAAFALVALLAAVGGCGGGEQAEPTPAARTATQESAAQEDDLPRGGTLRVGLVLWTLDHKYSLDPQTEYDYAAWELFRCCLVRTLLSYNGTPTAEGGAEPRPDLAAELPEVSADGLTWTFRVKQGVRYAPPYEDTEIVAGDVIRALERTLRPPPPAVAQVTGQATIGAYAFYYVPLIEGTEAFAAGEADSISGLEAPDDHTLVVHLTEPAGDLAHRFALAATAPIPPGAADGHDDGYGPFLVPSGPYMVEEFHLR